MTTTQDARRPAVSAPELLEPEQWTRAELIAELEKCRDQYDAEIWRQDGDLNPETLDHALDWSAALVRHTLDMLKDGRL